MNVFVEIAAIICHKQSPFWTAQGHCTTYTFKHPPCACRSRPACEHTSRAQVEGERSFRRRSFSLSTLARF
jgi:hypothetical protein